MTYSPDDRDPLTDLLRDERVSALLLALIPTIFTLIVAYAGGVRGISSLLGLGAAVYLILGATFVALPKRDRNAMMRYEAQTGETADLQKTIGRLGMDFFKKPTPEPLVRWFNPGIDEDALLASLVYLSSNAYIVDDGFKSMLSTQQEKKLRRYMIEKGFAYDSDEVYKGGWAITAAGRSIINRYLTHILLHVD